MADETTANALSAFSDQLADVVAQAARSIVTVAARPRQTATGILWKTETETIVMTADHVVEREDDIKVVLPDGKEVKAQMIGRDPSTDLAALRLPADALSADAQAAERGASLRPGNLVLAIGRPGSEGVRVSFGAVSSIDGPRRSWHGGEIEGVIYADVTLYPGFSGGPLVDLAGKVVGLNSSHLTRQNSSAIPLVTLDRVAKTLLTHGRVRRGYLGVGTQQVPLPEALAQKAGLTQESALLVVNVEAGSPADKGGLMLGDLLVLVGDQPIIDVDSLRAQLTSDKLDQTLSMRIIRGGEPQNLSITLGERK
ncbi:MAG: S1C family serine protease [Nitrososphaerota archaeon]